MKRIITSGTHSTVLSRGLHLSATTLLLWAAATSTSIAQNAATGFRPPNIPGSPAGASPAIPGNFEPGDLYLASSRVYVLVDKTGFGHQHGVVGQIKQGRIRLDLPQDSGQLVFDLATFAADPDLARQYVGLAGTEDPSSQQQVTANMLGVDVLDVAHFPTATFQIKKISPLPNPSQRNLPQLQLDGDFTLHGVTHPVSVIADAEQNGAWTHVRGGFAILQSQYRITPFTKALGAVGVADQLQIYGDLWLSKDRQTASPQ
jgi:polyisoprenoid-binding protein YceI